ncbi:MAG: hypothetical protein MRY83_04115 [Flavobacteriales bacterium]|nr:hypothetical protein [Flavobacteriales bacterium]
MDLKKVLFSTVLFTSSLVQIYAGGPWTLKKKEAFIQAQTTIPVYAYNSMLMGRFINDVQGVNRKTINADFGIYVEYGLLNNLTLIGKIPFKYVRTGELTDQTYFEDVLEAGSLIGMSNTEFDVKYKILDNKVKVALSANSLWNTINQDLPKGLATGFDANAFGMTAHIGRGNEKHYGFLEIGYQKYTNNFSDVIEIRIEHGWRLKNDLNIGVNLDARHSLENGSYFNENLAQTGLSPNDQEWAAIGVKAAYETKNGIGLNMAMPLIPIKFQYTGFNGVLSFGIYKKINS